MFMQRRRNQTADRPNALDFLVNDAERVATSQMETAYALYTFTVTACSCGKDKAQVTAFPNTGPAAPETVFLAHFPDPITAMDACCSFAKFLR